MPMPAQKEGHLSMIVLNFLVMKKISLRDFKKDRLTLSELTEVKGGSGFATICNASGRTSCIGPDPKTCSSDNRFCS